MSTIIRAQNISEAISIATEGKIAGRWNLFRGQTNASWRVTSTAERLAEVEREEALQEFTRFHNWAKSEQAMTGYFDKPDSLWAIAQHYGIKTNFIDFTDDPRVAAFFASDTAETPSSNQMAAIVCLETTDFERFRESVWPGLMRGSSNANPPEIIHIDVEDLWRLQQQRGCFLWNPVEDIEKHYNFDRIEFPYTGDDPILPRRDEIYPLNQSNLEKKIAAHFMNEHMLRNEKLIRELNWNVHRISVPVDHYDITSHFPNYSTDESDWNNLLGWIRPASEHATTVLPGAELCIPPDEDFSSLARQLLDGISVDFVRENRQSGLQFKNAKPVDIDNPLLIRIRRLWNGMRTLPYSEDEIVTSVTKVIDLFPLMLRGIDVRNVFGEEGAFVEMGGALDGKGAFSRAACTMIGFRAACRQEFIQVVRANKGLSDDVLNWHLLQVPARPWQRFKFAGLRKLMVEELIPTQVVWRATSEGADGLRRVIYFSPTDLKTFGLA
jgi:hypothetical protein